MLTKGKLDELMDLFHSPRCTVVVPHTRPDADALGSCLGLALYLKKYGHEVSVVSPDEFPGFLEWMPGVKDVIIYSQSNEKQVHDLFERAQLIVHIDHSQLSRCGDLGKISEKMNCPKLLIDHHIGKQDFADFEIWDEKAAASAELVYNLIVFLGDRKLVDNDIASCLYAGLVTDTGCFKYANVTPRVHHIAADLIESGINFALIHHLIYDSNTTDRMRFLGFALAEKLKVLESYGVAYFAISEEELKRFNHQAGDTEGVVNYALSIHGIKMAALFTEQQGEIRISFRSFGDFNVAKFSTLHFGGGGHKNAAGAKLDNVSITEAERRFLEILPKYQAEILAS